MVGRMKLEGGVTVDVTHAGGFAVVQLPGFGVAMPESAAKVIDADGKPLALVLSPLARWNQGYGGWARDDEWRFEDSVRQLAAHYGGTAVIR